MTCPFLALPPSLQVRGPWGSGAVFPALQVTLASTNTREPLPPPPRLSLSVAPSLSLSLSRSVSLSEAIYLQELRLGPGGADGLIKFPGNNRRGQGVVLGVIAGLVSGCKERVALRKSAGARVLISWSCRNT